MSWSWLGHTIPPNPLKIIFNHMDDDYEDKADDDEVVRRPEPIHELDSASKALHDIAKENTKAALSKYNF